jgi:biotin carboxyl carrier protein
VTYIKSPLVGTYYSTQALGYDPVEPGDKVTAGQAVCAVEAMKLMNVIEAEVAGEILEFMVEDGALVEYGQRLVKMRRG